MELRELGDNLSMVQLGLPIKIKEIEEMFDRSLILCTDINNDLIFLHYTQLYFHDGIVALPFDAEEYWYAIENDSIEDVIRELITISENEIY